ncbi:hypothetical protein [Streptomyces sp. GbtcB6]|uniref:hypothetical protein n=1 Tax=Streptomyces sp. GbtcB6 TaxID=2824751 RepID=UPI001C30ECB3|nr:hypothetical protein [Streptomyces sp. GbtcB6]
MDPFFAVAATEQVEFGATLAPEKALDLLEMTPSAGHLSRAELSDDGPLPDRITVSVPATAYRPR